MAYPDLWPRIRRYNLECFGEQIKPRFTAPESPLWEPQKQALQSLQRWFSDEQTRDLAAMVVMPTGSGKTGVICCLPFFMGGAVALGDIPRRVINMKKPVLIITPSIGIVDQLEDNLVTNPFLLKVGLLTEEERRYNYRVFHVKTTRDVFHFEYDIFLSDLDAPFYEDLLDLFSMVIVDEAHHLPAERWEEIIQKCHGHTKFVFFTAAYTLGCCDSITTDSAIKRCTSLYKQSKKVDMGMHLLLLTGTSCQRQVDTRGQDERVVSSTFSKSYSSCQRL